MDLDDGTLESCSHEDLCAHIRLQRVLVRHLYARVMELEKKPYQVIASGQAEVTSRRASTPHSPRVGGAATGGRSMNQTHVALLQQAYHLNKLQQDLVSQSGSIEGAAAMQMQISDLIAQALDAVVVAGGGGDELSSFPHTPPTSHSHATSPAPSHHGVSPRAGSTPAAGLASRAAAIHTAAGWPTLPPPPPALPPVTDLDLVDREIRAFKERVQGVLKSKPPPQPSNHVIEDDRASSKTSFHTAEDMYGGGSSGGANSRPTTPRENSLSHKVSTQRGRKKNPSGGSDSFKPLRIPSPERSQWQKPHEALKLPQTHHRSEALPPQVSDRRNHGPSHGSRMVEGQEEEIPQPRDYPSVVPNALTDRLSKRMNHLQQVRSTDCGADLELRQRVTDAQMQRLERFKNRREMFMGCTN